MRGGLPGVPPPGRLARGGRADEAALVRRRALLGQAGARLGRRAGVAAGRRTGPGGAGRQPHRPDLHRGPLRRLDLRRAAPGRSRHPAAQRARRRRAAAGRGPDGGPGPLRPAGQQAHARRAGHLRPLVRPGGAAAGAHAPGRPRARRLRLGGVPRRGGAARLDRAHSRGRGSPTAPRRPCRGRGPRRSPCSRPTTSASRTRSPGDSPRRCSTTSSPRPATSAPEPHAFAVA